MLKAIYRYKNIILLLSNTNNFSIENENKIINDFYIIKKAYCPAVLTENFFYDNKDDLKYLTSEEGIHAVVRTHVEGIIDYVNSKK